MKRDYYTHKEQRQIVRSGGAWAFCLVVSGVVLVWSMVIGASTLGFVAAAVVLVAAVVLGAGLFLPND